MNRILALFRERDTRDELGIGVIRGGRGKGTPGKGDADIYRPGKGDADIYRGGQNVRVPFSRPRPSSSSPGVTFSAPT
jgi:hypothetical protein